MWGDLVGASWHICGVSLYKYGASWLERVGINMVRVGWVEMVLGRIASHQHRPVKCFILAPYNYVLIRQP